MEVLVGDTRSLEDPMGNRTVYSANVWVYSALWIIFIHKDIM